MANEEIQLIDQSIDLVTKLVDAPLPVFLIIANSVLFVIVYRVVKKMWSHFMIREVRYGKLKAIAVGYKSKADNITPDQALIEIDRSLMDDK